MGFFLVLSLLRVLRAWPAENGEEANLTLIRGEKRTSKVPEWKGFSDPQKCRTNG